MKLRLKQFPAWALAAGLLCCNLATAATQAIESQFRLVEQRIATLKDQGDTAATNASLQAYQETLNQLQEARRFTQLAAQFESDRNTAAEDEAAIRERMAKSSGSDMLPDAAKLQELDWEALNELATQMRDALQSLLNKRDSLDQQIAAEAGNAESIRARLNALEAEQTGLPDSHASIEAHGVPSQFEATQWQLAAQHSRLNAERQALNAQLTNQPARSRVRRAQREEWVRNIEWLQQDLAVIDQYLTDKRPAQADQVLAQVPSGSDQYTLMQQLAEENASLAEHRSQLATALSRADAEKTRTDGKLFEVMEHFNSARRLVESGGNASVYGPFLMGYFMRLDQYRPPSQRLRQSNDISEIVIDRARHEQQQTALLDNRQFLNDKLEEMSLAPAANAEWVETARPLLEERHRLLAELLSSETELLQLLGRTDISYEQLGSLVAEFRDFLIGHILWVRSHLPLDKGFFKQLVQDLHQAKDSLRASMKFSGRKMAVALMFTGLLLLLLRRRMWRQIESINSHIGRPRDDSIRFSLKALLLTALRSAAVPLVMVGMALSIDNSQQDLLQPLALTLLLSAAGVMVALFLRDATAAGGLCRIHFGWDEDRCKGVSTLMSWILIRLMPMVILSSFLVHVERNTPHAVLGRMFLIVVAIMLALRLRRFLVRQRLNQSGGGIAPWLHDSLIFGGLGALVMIILSGFLLPARIIYYSVAITALALVALVFVHEMLMRWLLVTRRRIRFQGLVANLPDNADEEKASTEARQASLGDISDAAANLIKSMVYASGIVAVVLIWTPLLPAIQGLQRFSLWTVTQTVNGEQLQTHITLATLVLAVLVFVVTFYAARRIPALIELIMRSSGKSTPSGRYTVATITNYIIIAIGVMVFFSTLKMSWSQLQWLVAALGVGIGFGLQEIVANFISGLIILFERPIRVGDVVTIGESSGTVTRIQIRATTIRDWDGKELLVPNKEFVTGRLLNWTLSDTNNRITLDVGVAYGTDVGQAMQILEKIVNQNPAILKDPPPNILFTAFGDSALLLSVRCFLAELEDRLRKVSELNKQVYEEFNQAGIVIAFPQLDVHLDPDSPLTVKLQKEPGDSASG